MLSAIIGTDCSQIQRRVKK